uniref:Uncharacterized protein n=1 Tax=Leptobrachium leishanense TaxID=445787 RepID=A0A8C5P786_9ANUR
MVWPPWGVLARLYSWCGPPGGGVLARLYSRCGPPPPGSWLCPLHGVAPLEALGSAHYTVWPPWRLLALPITRCGPPGGSWPCPLHGVAPLEALGSAQYTVWPPWRLLALPITRCGPPGGSWLCPVHGVAPLEALGSAQYTVWPPWRLLALPIARCGPLWRVLALPSTRCGPPGGSWLCPVHGVAPLEDLGPAHYTVWPPWRLLALPSTRFGPIELEPPAKQPRVQGGEFPRMQRGACISLILQQSHGVRGRRERSFTRSPRAHCALSVREAPLTSARDPPSAPQGMTGAKICQRHRGEQRFATLYSTEHRIPLYSAFTYSEEAAPGGDWLLEPQLDDAGSNVDEATSQALEEDYDSSEYQPVSLFPASVNVLTNAVPLSKEVKEKWASEIDQFIKETLLPHCPSGENLHLIAGTVPSTVKVNDKVTVPEFVWLAACCNVPDAWSTGILKGTVDADNLVDITLEELENNFLGGAKLFANQCGGGTLPLQKSDSSDASTQTDAEPPAETTGPFFTCVLFLWRVAFEMLKTAFCIVWFFVKQVLNLVFGRLYWMWTALTTYVYELSSVLLNIPYDVLRVLGNVFCGLLGVVDNVFSVVCLILRLPTRFLCDVASFPYHTVCAIPNVGFEILSGICGVLGLGLNAVFGAFGGSFSVATFAGSSFFQRFVGQSETYDT